MKLEKDDKVSVQKLVVKSVKGFDAVYINNILKLTSFLFIISKVGIYRNNPYSYSGTLSSNVIRIILFHTRMHRYLICGQCIPEPQKAQNIHKKRFSVRQNMILVCY